MTSKAADLDIVLYRGWAKKNIYGWSPFCNKLELRFRLSGLPYRVDAGDPRSGPTAKLPYVTVTSKSSPSSSPPTKLGDSSLIVRDFVANGLVEDLNEDLDESTKTLDLGLQSLVEDRLYFYSLRERWMGANYWVQRDEVLGSLPYVVRVFVGNIIYRSIKATLYGQGTGRYSDEQVRGFTEEIWVRIDKLLVESRRKSAKKGKGECFWCLGGDEPTVCDTSVFGAVCAALVGKSNPESTKLVKSLDAVVDYANRIHNKYFPDYEKWEGGYHPTS